MLLVFHSHVVLFPPCGILHSHIDDTGTLNATLEEGPILPVISGNIPAGDLEMRPILLVNTAAGDLEMATKVRADTRLPFQAPSPTDSGSIVSKRSIVIPTYTPALPLAHQIVHIVMSLQFLSPPSTRQGQADARNCSHSVLPSKPFASFYSNTLKITCPVLLGAAQNLP